MPVKIDILVASVCLDHGGVYSSGCSVHLKGPKSRHARYGLSGSRPETASLKALRIALGFVHHDCWDWHMQLIGPEYDLRVIQPSYTASDKINHEKLIRLVSQMPNLEAFRVPVDDEVLSDVLKWANRSAIEQIHFDSGSL